MTKTAKKAAIAPPNSGQVELRDLADLLLDRENPRFGLLDGKLNQADILDHIVNTFGVDDVLSSLSVNGYFHAEPLVCRKDPNSDKLTVVEGNRRLSACLIITGDARAARQTKRTAEYRGIWEKHEKPTIEPVPVIIYDESKEKSSILSYLGVRHIASAQPWDSYAKAAWVAKVFEEDNNLELNDVALMIGDKHQTISKLLEGYYLIQQLEEAGEFVPENSQRKGRGSVSSYPFSWVYTMLGYSTARKFLGLTDSQPKKTN